MRVQDVAKVEQGAKQILPATEPGRYCSPRHGMPSIKTRGFQMRVDDVAGKGPGRILLAKSYGAILLKTRGFEMRVNRNVVSDM